MMRVVALAFLLALKAASAESDVEVCGDSKRGFSDCAKRSYKTSAATSADACCALCDADPQCKQWTYHSFSRKCALTEEAEDPSGGFFSTCGIKPVPTPAPTPMPPPGPTPPPGSATSQWAVIAAGSAGFGNYRHQADACHAYHVMIRSGIPADHIILMMEDDIANSHENPFPGKMYNRPGNDAPDVYEDCKIDYKGSVVTAKLFMSVITGDQAGVPNGGRVLQSGPSDRVFLNFVDHGGVGILAFPHGEPLHVKDLSQTLKTMKSKNMFKDLLFYVEACESGSMFPDLAKDEGIFAVTAANAKESSWGWYCGSIGMGSDLVHGKSMHTCLGDLFSIAWMESADVDFTQTISKQIEAVTKRTNKSHVMTFGDKSFEDTPIGKFELAASGSSTVSGKAESVDSGMNVRDIPLQMAYAKWNDAKTESEKKEAWEKLASIVANRKADEEIFERIVYSVCRDIGVGCAQHLKESRLTMIDQDCHKTLVNTVHEHCPRREPHNAGGWNGFNSKFSQTLVNICETLSGEKKNNISTLVRAECQAESKRVHAMSNAAVVV